MNTGLINITGVNYLVATPVLYWAHSGVSTCQGDPVHFPPQSTAPVSVPHCDQSSTAVFIELYQELPISAILLPVV